MKEVQELIGLAQSISKDCLRKMNDGDPSGIYRKYKKLSECIPIQLCSLDCFSGKVSCHTAFINVEFLKEIHRSFASGKLNSSQYNYYVYIVELVQDSLETIFKEVNNLKAS